MNASGRLIINAVWDDEVRVWVATSDEVPGLATEADDMDALVEKLTADTALRLGQWFGSGPEI